MNETAQHNLNPIAQQSPKPESAPTQPSTITRPTNQMLKKLNLDVRSKVKLTRLASIQKRNYALLDSIRKLRAKYKAPPRKQHNTFKAEKRLSHKIPETFQPAEESCPGPRVGGLRAGTWSRER